MIQPIGNGENKIGFLDTDWKKLAQEVQGFKDAHEKKKNDLINKPTVTIAKQTTGNMYQHKLRNSIPFLDNEVQKPEAKKAETIQAEPAHKLNSKFDQNPGMTGKSIMSAQCGEIRDTGGPIKHVGVTNGNSIWDSEVLARAYKELSNKEKTLQEKEAVVVARKTLRQQSNDSLVKALEEVDQRKDSQVTPIAEYAGSKYQAPKHNMSIFDKTDNAAEFGRISEKTGGEKISERKKIEEDPSRPKLINTESGIGYRFGS